MLLVAPTGYQASHSHAFITSGNTPAWLIQGTISGFPNTPWFEYPKPGGRRRTPRGVTPVAPGRYNVPQ